MRYWFITLKTKPAPRQWRNFGAWLDRYMALISKDSVLCFRALWESMMISRQLRLWYSLFIGYGDTSKDAFHAKHPAIRHMKLNMSIIVDKYTVCSWTISTTKVRPLQFFGNYTMCPIRCAYSFIFACFVVVILSFLLYPSVRFTNLVQGCFERWHRWMDMGRRCRNLIKKISTICASCAWFIRCTSHLRNGRC